MANTSDDKTLVGTVMKNGGGATAGAVVGGAVVAPLAVWGLGIALAPVTGGLSIPVVAGLTALGIVGGAVVGHQAAKDMN